MTGKDRFIVPVVTASMMAFPVSAVISFVNLGFAPDFFALPLARAATTAIVVRIGE